MRKLALRFATAAAAILITASAAQAQELNTCGHRDWKTCNQLNVVNTYSDRYLWVTIYFLGGIRENRCVDPKKQANVPVPKPQNENSNYKLRGEMTTQAYCKGDRTCDTDISAIRSGGRYEIRPTANKEKYDCHWMPIPLEKK